MKKFITKILILIIINIAVYNLLIYSFYGKSFLSSICTAPRNEKYDFVLLGTSHGQVFYKYIVDDLLSKSMKNLASGASGVIPQKIQLECFFETNNKAKQIIYFLDPWALYSSRWNESNYIMQQEGIEYSYLLKLLKNNVDKKVLFNYFRDKLVDNYDKFIRGLLTPKIIPTVEKTKTTEAPKGLEKIKTPEEKYAESQEAERAALEAKKTPEEQRKINETADKQRLEILYNEGTQDKFFLKYSKEVEKVILLSIKNNAKIVFIIPPTLMGEMPGEEKVINLLSSLRKKYAVDYFDLSNEMQDQEFYWDREHLNKTGVEYFTQNYLKKLVE